MTTINANKTTATIVETNLVDNHKVGGKVVPKVDNMVVSTTLVDTTTTPTTRLPRYRRAATEVGFTITERDFAILALVYAYRLISSEHIQALVAGSNQGLLRRLQVLFHAGYLDRLRPQWQENGGSAKMIYAITNQGIRTLQKAGRIERITTTDVNAQNRSLDGLFVDHTLLITHIRAAFSLAGHAGYRLVDWKEGRELFDRVEIALDRGYVSSPVAPDAFFSLQDAQGRRLHFCLEADRGTMTTKRFLLKLRAYAAYFAEKKHEAKYGIRYFRVLSVIATTKRKNHLTEKAAALEELRRYRRMFLFTDAASIALARPESALDKIWSVPGETEQVSIIGAPAKTPKAGGM